MIDPPPPSARDYLELTKPRLSLLSVLTAVFGYLAALPAWDLRYFVFLLIGTSACAAGVASLNQWMESDTDARMKRTADRPIPSGRMPTGSAFVMGWGFCLIGLFILFALVNGGAALFALLTIISYLSFYTPSKRWSRWSTEIGAIAGAFPPLIGWAAAGGQDSGLGWVLFGLLFFWQIPHFMAIAWIYRADYAEVHFPMLAVRDQTGNWVAGWSFVTTVASVAVASLPTVLKLTGWTYLAFTILLGGWFLARAWTFLSAARRCSAAGANPEILVPSARRLFLASVTWLPLQMLLLVLLRHFQAP